MGGALVAVDGVELGHGTAAEVAEANMTTSHNTARVYYVGGGGIRMCKGNVTLHNALPVNRVR